MVSRRRAYKKEADGLTASARYRLKNVEEYRKKKNEWAKTPEEKEKRRKRQQEWREKNREHYNKWSRENHQKHKDKIKPRIRNYRLKKKYGIDVTQYNEMLLAQGGCCKICQTDKSGKYAFHVDHCHKTGRIRGLLCANCNTVLGFYETRLAELEEKIKKYLGAIW